MTDVGRVPLAPGSRASHGAGQAVSTADSGFDPSRIRLNGYEVKALTALAAAPEDHYWPFARIQQASGLPKIHVRRIVRLLARKGLARFASGLTNDDGGMAGAGYQLTEAGRSLCASN